MRRQKRQTCKGYLTIYISLTLTVMLSLCLTLIEGARQSTIRFEAECMMDTALNSIMAEYHRELFEQYHLFYIDSSYGSDYPSYYNTEARLQYYLEQNLDMAEAGYFDLVYKDLLEMELADMYVKDVALATDGAGVLFRKQAVATVWDDIGLGVVEDVLEWMEIIESKGLLKREIKEEKEAIDEQLNAYDDTWHELEDQSWIAVDIINPTEHIETMRKQGVLKWVLESDVVLSGQVVDLNQYISARRRRGEINQGNLETTMELSDLEKILFHEYVLRYAGHYGQEKEGSLLKYQAEYLVAGKEKDTDNLKKVTERICAIREVANTIYLYQDAEKAAVADSLAWILASAVFCPETQPLFKATLIMGWAYVESLYDTKLILAGGQVPLMKAGADWHYDLDSIMESVDMKLQKEKKEEKVNGGLDYKDYLHVLIYLTGAETLTFRFMDLVEMDIRMTQGNEAFRMDGCIESVGAECIIESGYGGWHLVQGRKQYY